ncbi:Crp/Fnr family transcriptional regulator [Streptomyces sp. NBC_00286]|uniref:Crp/Fnr family transcriptional regulator n=1 Tax=Streptomyces sp. NBC_00286 TaxID=2975701 RepID=UPI002E27DC78|nr:cyclic nucleotide-binding domain-containing protein [Streptomyces sp. NBC_00286]
MATTLHLSPSTAAIPVHAVWGAAAGLVGGVGLGIWMSVSRPMADTTMIIMVAGLLGSTNAVVGWLIHLSIALLAGIGFGVLLGQFAQRLAPAVVLGLAYGAVWWTVGALWIMPANMGMPVFEWNDVTSSSLGGHLVFGRLAGATFALVAQTAGNGTDRTNRMTPTPPASTPDPGAPLRGTEPLLGAPDDYCLAHSAGALAGPAWGAAPPPWAPGRREEPHHMTHTGDEAQETWCISEVDIFRDLDDAEMNAIAAPAPMKTYSAGELLYSPSQPAEVLFILKKSRVRIFRVSADGRALTCAITSPGTIFGEMVLLGQRMYDTFAEALDDVTVCVMSRADVHRFLPRRRPRRPLRLV